MSSAVVHLIDDDEHVRRALAFLLGTAGFAVRVYDSASVFLEKFEQINWLRGQRRAHAGH